MVEGVPYFDDEAAEVVVEEECSGAFSLNQQVEIDGEVWVAEGPATPAPPKERLYPDLAGEEEGATSADPDWTPVLLLIPVRLGGDRLNPIYIPCLKALLASDSWEAIQ